MGKIDRHKTGDKVSFIVKGVRRMEYLFIEYPKCSTCKKAKRWLEEHQITFDDRHIILDNPKKEELKRWLEESKLPLKKFFNTSGNLYKELNLKDRLPNMTEDEQIDLLSTNGMLVKRPLLISENNILIGFKEDEWEKVINHS
jgi:arsenate reductase